LSTGFAALSDMGQPSSMFPADLQVADDVPCTERNKLHGGSQMTKMMSVLAVVLALVAGVAGASGGGVTTGKSYKINLSFGAKLGSNEMAPGSYKVSVDGNSVHIVNSNSGKGFDAPVKVETGETKFDHTAITTEKIGEAVQIREIRLGGSKTLLNFR